MGQNSVRGEGTRGRVPRARERGWDDEPYDAGAGTGDGADDAPEEADAEAPADTTTRAERRRGAAGKGAGG
ncbi:LytR family transcriptional regulator, partial [Streptomyces sp. SID6041]|nr:LytR family transcriptional regulator [Streptomyces sp. SID6041]